MYGLYFDAEYVLILGSFKSGKTLSSLVFSKVEYTSDVTYLGPYQTSTL